MWKVQLFELNYDEREERAVQEVLRSRWITMGDRTRAFEEAFGTYLKSELLPTAVANGTAALHMALLALGIGSGDEVVISGLTFVADANVVTMVGARPVLADIASLSNWNVSAETIEAKITSRTKAVLIVHYGGVPCDMDDIIRLCKEKNLRLIEDVAHAPGAEYDGKKCGVFGDVSCFSFFTNKNLSVGEGGMVVAKDPDVNNSLKYLRSHGMSTLTLDRHQGRAITYDVLQAGLNYRMDEMRAALGIVQLEKLDEANLQRAALTRIYNQQLSDLEDIQIPFQELLKKTSAYHIYPTLLSRRIEREKLFLSLKSKGIQASIHYPPIKSFSAYKTELAGDATPNCDIVCARELTLPLFPTMKEEAVSLVVSALRESLIEQA